MSNESNRATFTPDQIKQHVLAVEKAVEQLRQQAKGGNFTALNAKEVERKLNRVNSPFITGQGWNHTTQGGTVNLILGIYNPDPFQAYFLHAHAWVGSGNADPVVGTFLTNVDTRFPRLTQPEFPGLQLAPGASTVLSFSLTVPASVDDSNYLGNTCLMMVDFHDVGTYLDRSVFPFRVQ